MIGGLLVAAVFIAVAVHAHSSRGAAVLAAVAPAKGGASQLFRGSEYLNRGHARRARRLLERARSELQHRQHAF